MMQLLVACGFAAVGAMLFVSLRSRLDGLHRLIARTSHLERALLVVLAAAFVAYGGSKPVSVTVPDAENTTVEVKTNGVTVATAPDTFTFQSGSSLSVVYTATNEHYQITANASTNIDFLFDAVMVTAPTVKPIVVTSVTLNVAATNLNIGESFQLVETVEPANALDKTIAWTSSDNAVATVTDKGVVTAVGTGTATVTATNAASGVFAACVVSVGIPMYEMTVAKVDHATVAAVSNGTVAVEFTSGDDGVKFTVPSNSTVKVYFAPEEGYSLDTSVVEQTVTSAGAIDVSGIIPTLITFNITIDSAIEHGTVETSVTNDVVPGAEVTLTVAADEGYALQNLSVMSGDVPVTLTDDGKFTMPKGGVNITATFTQLVFTVTFTTNGVVYAVSNNVPWGTAIDDVLPSPPEVDGYDFQGWELNGVGEILKDETFAAKLAIKMLTVEFWANGVLYAASSNDVPWGTAFDDVKPKIAPTSTTVGENFANWEPYDVSYIISNMTFTAKFTAETVYTLTLNAGANTTLTAAPSKENYFAGDVVTLTATPVKNHKFDASTLPEDWKLDDAGAATNFVTITGNITVDGPAAVLDTVTFTVKAIPGAKVDKVYTNAGENAWIECGYTVIRGAKVKVTFEPDDAYQLTASEFVTDALMDDSTEIDAAETIKPVALYTVTFKVEGQADYVTNSIPSNTEFAVIRPADPTAPTGQSFKCWEPVEEFVVSNTTYTAAFTNNFYDITFKNADGTWSEVVSTEYNVMPVEPAAPDVTGHSFKEWTPAVVAAVEDATYTAVYTANVYAVTFADGNNSTITPTAGTQYYDYGTALEITATAAEGYEFAEASYEGWEKQSNSTLTTNVTVTAAATFAAPDATVAIATVDVTLPEKLPDGVEKLVVSQSEDGEQWVEVTDGKVIVGYQWKVEGVAKEGYTVENPIVSGTAESGQTIEVTEEEVQGKVTANTFTVEVPAAANATVAVSTNDVAAGADGTYTLGSGTKVVVVYTPEAGYRITANASTNIASLVENVTVAAPTVEEIMVEAVSLDCVAKTLDVGDSFTLGATVEPEDALDKTIVWSSSDSRIAKVDDDGVVTAVCKGTATIKATNAASGVFASCTVTVGLVPSGTVTKPKADDSGMVKGKSGSWSAKPNEACVFTGWVWEGEPEKLPAEFTSLSENELRNAKIKIANVSGVRPADVAATWAWIDEDKIESVDLTPSNLVVECKSYVTASAGGLPSGLKFDKKTLKITGLPKKTESKEVKVKIKNASGYTWNQSFTVEATAGVGITKITPADNAVKTGVPVMLVGGDSALGAVKGSKVIVAGKKASIKATPAKGSIFLGWYEDAVFDTPATWLQKGYLTASQPVQVANDDITLYARIVKLETWAQGTFDGVYFETGDEGDESLGTVTFTVSNKGKVSGKTLETGSSSAFKANMIEDAYYDADGAITYVVNPIAKVDGVEQKLKVEISFDEDANLGSAVIKYGEDADSPYAAAVQNGWKLKPVWLPGFAKGLAKTLDNGLTFSFGAKGSVKISGTYAGVKVSAKAQLLPVEWDAAEKTLKARVCVYLPKSSPLICETYDFVLTAGADGNFSTVEESED